MANMQFSHPPPPPPPAHSAYKTWTDIDDDGGIRKNINDHDGRIRSNETRLADLHTMSLSPAAEQQLSPTQQLQQTLPQKSWKRFLTLRRTKSSTADLTHDGPPTSTMSAAAPSLVGFADLDYYSQEEWSSFPTTTTSRSAHSSTNIPPALASSSQASKTRRQRVAVDTARAVASSAKQSKSERESAGPASAGTDGASPTGGSSTPGVLSSSSASISAGSSGPPPSPLANLTSRQLTNLAASVLHHLGEKQESIGGSSGGGDGGSHAITGDYTGITTEHLAAARALASPMRHSAANTADPQFSQTTAKLAQLPDPQLYRLALDVEDECERRFPDLAMSAVSVDAQRDEALQIQRGSRIFLSLSRKKFGEGGGTIKRSIKTQRSDPTLFNNIDAMPSSAPLPTTDAPPFRIQSPLHTTATLQRPRTAGLRLSQDADRFVAQPVPVKQVKAGFLTNAATLPPPPMDQDQPSHKVSTRQVRPAEAQPTPATSSKVIPQRGKSQTRVPTTTPDVGPRRQRSESHSGNPSPKKDITTPSSIETKRTLTVSRKPTSQESLKRLDSLLPKRPMARRMPSYQNDLEKIGRVAAHLKRHEDHDIVSTTDDDDDDQILGDWAVRKQQQQLDVLNWRRRENEFAASTAEDATKSSESDLEDADVTANERQRRISAAAAASIGLSGASWREWCTKCVESESGYHFRRDRQPSPPPAQLQRSHTHSASTHTPRLPHALPTPAVSPMANTIHHTSPRLRANGVASPILHIATSLSSVPDIQTLRAPSPARTPTPRSASPSAKDFTPFHAALGILTTPQLLAAVRDVRGVMARRHGPPKHRRNGSNTTIQIISASPPSTAPLTPLTASPTPPSASSDSNPHTSDMEDFLDDEEDESLTYCERLLLRLPMSRVRIIWAAVADEVRRRDLDINVHSRTARPLVA
ncbi:hypothetical protein DFS34DRAFT_592141 [Phlyctochytrium arcticum]|nr:hypothetical protein DFS34DRAFT_592141 [Phlyctochytrium arcticum]